MQLRSLSLSAHASTLLMTAAPIMEPNPFAGQPCRFCGQVSGIWQEPYHLDGDHTNDVADNLVASCPLCHLVQHLERPRIEEEAALIWLPEMSQRALIALARTLHLKLHAAGEPLDVAVAASNHAEACAHFCRTRQELLARAAPAKTRLGAALRALPAAVYARRDQLLGGLRLLPLGRLYHGDQDVYPDILATWAGLAQATGGKGKADAETTVG